MTPTEAAAEIIARYRNGWQTERPLNVYLAECVGEVDGTEVWLAVIDPIHGTEGIRIVIAEIGGEPGLLTYAAGIQWAMYQAQARLQKLRRAQKNLHRTKK